MQTTPSAPRSLRRDALGHGAPAGPGDRDARSGAATDGSRAGGCGHGMKRTTRRPTRAAAGRQSTVPRRRKATARRLRRSGHAATAHRILRPTWTDRAQTGRSASPDYEAPLSAALAAFFAGAASARPRSARASLLARRRSAVTMLHRRWTHDRTGPAPSMASMPPRSRGRRTLQSAERAALDSSPSCSSHGADRRRRRAGRAGPLAAPCRRSTGRSRRYARTSAGTFRHCVHGGITRPSTTGRRDRRTAARRLALEAASHDRTGVGRHRDAAHLRFRAGTATYRAAQRSTSRRSAYAEQRHAACRIVVDVRQAYFTRAREQGAGRRRDGDARQSEDSTSTQVQGFVAGGHAAARSRSRSRRPRSRTPRCSSSRAEQLRDGEGAAQSGRWASPAGRTYDVTDERARRSSTTRTSRSRRSSRRRSAARPSSRTSASSARRRSATCARPRAAYGPTLSASGGASESALVARRARLRTGTSA